MFRDLKEYQEIAKIYADKVSKPEELDENRNTRGSELAKERLANKPKTRAEVGLPPKRQNFDDRRKARGSSYRGRPEPKYKPEKGVVFGQRTNEVGALGGGKPSSVPVPKPEVSKLTKQGKPRTKAQMMAAKRIAAGKTISDVKAENEASMRAKAAERNQKFQAAKKSGNLAQFRKDNPKMSGADRAKAMAKARLAKKAAMEEYTPYDIVLEYLLSTEQVATIEEANYVMTEMDGKTIQDIVEMQGQVNRADIIGGTQAAKNAAAGKGKYTPGKGVTKDFKLDPSFKLPKA